MADAFVAQSFGEVRHITRKPNGELHVDFRKSSVADTVSRSPPARLVALLNGYVA